MTLTPGGMTENDVQLLRTHGFDDPAITIAAQVIGYFNYINRLSDALGVDPEPWMSLPRAQWLKEKGRDYQGL